MQYTIKLIDGNGKTVKHYKEEAYNYKALEPKVRKELKALDLPRVREVINTDRGEEVIYHTARYVIESDLKNRFGMPVDGISSFL